jgi:hypothetical protein
MEKCRLLGFLFIYETAPDGTAYYMRTLMGKLKVEEDRLDQGQDDSGGEYEKMKLESEKRIDLYKRFLKKEGLTELDRLRLANNKEWTMNHLLNLIIEQELRGNSQYHIIMC